MSDFSIVANQAGNAADVVVTGELDMYTAPRLRQELVGLMAQGALQVTVDLAAVEFIDSTALGVLVGGLKRLRQAGGELELRSPRPGALKVMEMTGLTRIFTINSDGQEPEVVSPPD